MPRSLQCFKYFNAVVMSVGCLSSAHRKVYKQGLKEHGCTVAFRCYSLLLGNSTKFFTNAILEGLQPLLRIARRSVGSAGGELFQSSTISASLLSLCYTWESMRNFVQVQATWTFAKATPSTTSCMNQIQDFICFAHESFFVVP